MFGRKNAPLDMCNGPVISQMLRFAVPLILSNTAQRLYNTADLVVVGRFSGSMALAAVGSTASLLGLLISAFISLSVGANVVIARAIGAGDTRRTATATHTAMLLSAVCGLLLGVFMLILSEQMLIWTAAPPEVLADAALYMRILATGFPASLIYNFGAAVLRSAGDTRRPLYFLLLSGLVNVLLNLFFAAVCGMGVAGVAIATVVSQYISAALVVLSLCHREDNCRLFLRRLAIHQQDLKDILIIGIPSALQSACFDIANVLIQSSINSFGALTVAGNTAAGNIDTFIYGSIHAISQTVLTFAGQNMGARQYSRIPKILRAGLLLDVLVGGGIGLVCLLFRVPLLSLFAKEDMTVIAYGITRLFILCPTYWVCGWLDAYSGTLRAMGNNTLPTVISVFGVCGIRILIVMTVFRRFHMLEVLYGSYPVSWIITTAVLFVAYHVYYRRMLSRQAEVLREPVTK